MRGNADPTHAVDESQAPARVGVLGPLELWVAEKPVGLGPVERAVLAVLAAHVDTTVPLEALIDVVWPDDANPAKRKVLQNHVSRLRRSLGHPESVETAPVGYRMVGALVETDWVVATARDRDATAARRQGNYSLAQQLTAQARDLWRGAPLTDVADHPRMRPVVARFDEWAERLAEDWIEDSLVLGQHHEVLPFLDAMVADHPFRERRWGQLMRALYRSGRQAEALGAYQRLRRHLSEELGINPGSDLTALERAIVDQDPDLDWHPPVEVSAVGRLTVTKPSRADFTLPDDAADELFPPMVGRDADLDALTGLIRDARAGAVPSVATVVSEPGCGKSRLLTELSRRSRAANAVALIGTADEDALSYRTLADITRRILALDPEAPSRLGHLEVDLRWLVPELGPVPAASDPGLARGRMFESVLALLSTACGEAPLVLCFDDVQRLGQGIRAFLATLLERQLPRPVVVILASRTGDDEPASREGPLSRALGRPDTLDIRLGRLGQDEITSLLELIGEPAATAPAAARTLVEQTGGIPLLVREVLAERSTPSGTPRRATSDQRLVDSIIALSLRRLSAPTLRIMQIAAVVGSDIDPLLVCTVGECPSGDVEDALDEAMSAGGLVRNLDDERIVFDHDLVRQVLAGQLTPIRRNMLQRKTAEELARLGSHFAAARRALVSVDVDPTRRVLQQSLRGGAEAMAALDFEGARDLCRDARRLMSDLIEPALRVEVLILLAVAEIRSGDAETGDLTFLEAAGVARSDPDPELMARVALATEVRARLAQASAARWQVLGEALAALDVAWTPLRIELSAEWLLEAALPAHRQATMELAETVLAQARENGDPRLVLKAGQARELVARNHNLPADPDALAQLAVLAHRLGGVEAEFEARLRVLVEALGRGARTAMATEVAHLEQLAQAAMDPRTSWRFGIVQITLCRLTGDFDAASLRAQALLQDGLRHGLGDALGAFLVQTFNAAVHLGGLATLRDPMAELSRRQPNILAWELGAALSATVAGDEIYGRRVFDRAREVLVNEAADETWLLAMCLVVELGAQLGCLDVAADALDSCLRPFSGRYVVLGAFVGDFGPVDRCRGLLAAAAGNLAEAERHFATADRLCEQVGAMAWQLRTRVDWSRSTASPDRWPGLAAELEALGWTGTLEKLARAQSLRSI